MEDIMKNIILILCCIIFLFGYSSSIIAEIGKGTPLKYISSCEIDLNNDGISDIAFLVETVRGRELIVLIRTDNGYTSYLVSEGKSNMYLSCHYGKYIKETSAGKVNKEENKIHETLGTYIKLTQPECCSVAYFWNKNTNSFQKVITSD